MSERTPLLSGTVNGPSVSSLQSTAQQAQSAVVRNMPSKTQRIRVAEALGALSAGKLPSQDQLDRYLDIILESDTLKPTGGPGSRTARLGADGQRVIGRLKDVLAAGKAWGTEKNGDDLLQNLFYNVETADVNIDVDTPNLPASKSELKRDADRAVDSFRTIASLVVTNDNFRELASDLVLLARDIFADAASAAASRAQDAAEATRPSDRERQQGVDFEKAKQKGKATARGVKSGKLQGEARESLWAEIEGAKQYLDEKLPEGEDARDQLVERLQKVVTQAQSDPQYRRALHSIVGLVKKYARKAESALEEAKENTDVDDSDAKVQQAGRDLKAFIEKIANKSLDDVIKTVQKVADDVRIDDKLSTYFDELDKYLDRLLYQPGYVVSQRAYRKAVSLYDDAQSLLAENADWKRDAGALQRELEAVVKGIKNDGATNRLVGSIEALGDAVQTAGQIGLGSLKVDGQGFYRDVVDVLLPRVIGLVQHIPVPRVEYKSADVDLVIDDFNLDSASFIPDSIRLVSHNDLRFTQGYATYASEYDGTVRLKVDGLHFSASNIAFWVSKKTGFLPFEDSGILDFQFGPDGISFDVTLENADEDDRETFFTVKDVKVHISGFDFKISKNQRWFATWFFKPVLHAFIQRNLSSALESTIVDYLQTLDFKLFAVQQRAIAATNARPSPLNWAKAVFNDSLFGGSAFGTIQSRGPKGVVKYGRKGEYLLHVGVDEDLFPDQPPAHVRNQDRLRLKAEAHKVKETLKGAADQFAGQANGAAKDAANAANKVGREANELSARVKEEQRRAERSEGWRSDAFDV
ncbi:hypothetical protein Q5752_004644 [Cryptotrichosporon argae]